MPSFFDDLQIVGRYFALGPRHAAAYLHIDDGAFLADASDPAGCGDANAMLHAVADEMDSRGMLVSTRELSGSVT